MQLVQNVSQIFHHFFINAVIHCSRQITKLELITDL